MEELSMSQMIEVVRRSSGNRGNVREAKSRQQGHGGKAGKPGQTGRDFSRKCDALSRLHPEASKEEIERKVANPDVLVRHIDYF
ncbi:MAG: hypothetical protein Q8P90_04040 [bacterium]|nr:hypothetical protein [bacterium]